MNPVSSDLPDLCPYLSTVDGTWRSASAAREHRCVAVTPPVPLAFEKQRRLCLLAQHRACSTYGAALAARPLYALTATPRGRVIARTTPVVLDQTRFDLHLPALRSDRVSGQGLLVVLLALAFVAVLSTRPASDNGTAGGGARTPSPTTVAAASATPNPSPKTPAATSRPIESAPGASSTTPTNTPASAQPTTPGARYTVKRGDTLSAIAARFGTTVKVLVDLNRIKDPSRIRPGQVLQLP